jgi:dipeptidyl aminopeptidase/acylaminoacyl peptidase
MSFNAFASDPDGTIISSADYILPAFETTAFRQAPDMRTYYETQIRGNLTTDIKTIEYSSDGLKIKGFILTPKGISPNTKLPIVVWNRSGNRDFNSLDVNDMIWLSKLSQKGYVVVASQYRGVNGEKGNDEFGGKDVDDVLNIIKVAKTLPQADSKNIFMAGHSRGGMETYLALKADSEIKAAVTLAGECDLAAGLKSRPTFEKDVYEEMIPNYKLNKTQALTSRSACSWPESIHTPLYLLQGRDDKAVDPEQAREFEKKLKAAKKTVKVGMVPGGHNRWFQDEHADDTMNRLDKWFRKYYHPSKGVNAQIADIQKQVDSIQGALTAPHREGPEINSESSLGNPPSDNLPRDSDKKDNGIEAGSAL